jgi:ADP-ribose pyrophosphatase YjhB (NUDIX family)
MMRAPAFLPSVAAKGIQHVFRLLAWATFGHLPPFPAVCGLMEQSGWLLLIERSDGLGLCLPGGLMKSHETPEEALVREVFEETGYRVTPVALIAVHSNPQCDPRFPCLLLAYHTRIVGGRQRASAEGRAIWRSPDRLAGRLAFDHDLIVHHYLRMKGSVQAAEAAGRI